MIALYFGSPSLEISEVRRLNPGLPFLKGTDLLMVGHKFFAGHDAPDKILQGSTLLDRSLLVIEQL